MVLTGKLEGLCYWIVAFGITPWLMCLVFALASNAAARMAQLRRPAFSLPLPFFMVLELLFLLVGAVAGWVAWNDAGWSPIRLPLLLYAGAVVMAILSCLFCYALFNFTLGAIFSLIGCIAAIIAVIFFFADGFTLTAWLLIFFALWLLLRFLLKIAMARAQRPPRTAQCPPTQQTFQTGQVQNGQFVSTGQGSATFRPGVVSIGDNVQLE